MTSPPPRDHRRELNVVPTFDAEGGYVWRDQRDGRELTADELEALGYDPGVCDSPEVWATPYVREKL